MWHVWRRGEVQKGFWWGKLGGRRPLGRPSHIWEYIIIMDLQEMVCGVWTGTSWLRIGTGGGHLRKQ